MRGRRVPRGTLAAALLCTGIGAAIGQAPVPPAADPAGTPVRLMVLNEVTSRTAHAGDRFVLLLDQPLPIGGTIVPAGSRAWGEVLETRRNGSAGTGGRLSTRLLWLEAGTRRIALCGTTASAGANAVLQMGAVGATMGLMAPIALLARGNDGKLKAGEIVTGYVAADVDVDAPAP